MVNPTSSSPSVAPIGTSTDSSARTSAPPTPRRTVSGTSTVPTPPSSAPPTPSAPTRELSAPVPPLVPARSPVGTRERHPAATRASTCSTAGRPPSKYGDYVHFSVAPPAHFAPLYLSHFIAAPSVYAAAAAPDPDTLTHDQAASAPQTEKSRNTRLGTVSAETYRKGSSTLTAPLSRGRRYESCLRSHSLSVGPLARLISRRPLSRPS
jgi:hypothetical protein